MYASLCAAEGQPVLAQDAFVRLRMQVREEVAPDAVFHLKSIAVDKQVIVRMIVELSAGKYAGHRWQFETGR